MAHLQSATRNVQGHAGARQFVRRQDGRTQAAADDESEVSSGAPDLLRTSTSVSNSFGACIASDSATCRSTATVRLVQHGYDRG